MNLRAQLETRTATLSDLALAAEQRYWEGVQLGTDGYFGAAIYQLGFAVEMWLKYAALRIDGLSPASTLGKGSYKPAERFLRLSGREIPPESWHSLRFWGVYLQTRRTHQNRPLNGALGQSLVHRTNRLYGVWWVSMRYFPDQASDYDIRRAYDDAGWFRANLERLWS